MPSPEVITGTSFLIICQVLLELSREQNVFVLAIMTLTIYLGVQKQ